jgi:hypothetical protein
MPETGKGQRARPPLLEHLGTSLEVGSFAQLEFFQQVLDAFFFDAGIQTSRLDALFLEMPHRFGGALGGGESGKRHPVPVPSALLL